MPLSNKQKKQIKEWQEILNTPDKLIGMPKYEAEELLSLCNELKDPKKPELTLSNGGDITPELIQAFVVLLEQYKNELAADGKLQSDSEKQSPDAITAYVFQIDQNLKLDSKKMKELVKMQEQCAMQLKNSTRDDPNYVTHEHIHEQVSAEIAFREVVNFIVAQYHYFQHIFDKQLFTDTNRYPEAVTPEENLISKFTKNSATTEQKKLVLDLQELLQSFDTHTVRKLCENFALINNPTVKKNDTDRYYAAIISIRNTLLSNLYPIVENLFLNHTSHKEAAAAFKTWLSKQNPERQSEKKNNLLSADARQKTVAYLDNNTLEQMYAVIEMFYNETKDTLSKSKALSDKISTASKNILERIPELDKSTQAEKLKNSFPVEQTRYLVELVGANLVNYYQSLIVAYKKKLLDDTSQDHNTNKKMLESYVERLNKLPKNGFTDHIIYSLKKLVDEYQDKINSIATGHTQPRITAEAKTAAVAPMQSSAPTTRNTITTAADIKLPQKPKPDPQALQPQLAALERVIKTKKMFGDLSDLTILQDQYITKFNSLLKVKQQLYKIPDGNQIPSSGSGKPKTPVEHCAKIMDLFFAEADKIVKYMMDYSVNVGKRGQQDFYGALDKDLNKCLSNYVEAILNLVDNASDDDVRKIIDYFSDRENARNKSTVQYLRNLYERANLPEDSPQLDIGSVDSVALANAILYNYFALKYLKADFAVNRLYEELENREYPYPWFNTIEDRLRTFKSTSKPSKI